jgi:hypothetical protein
MRPSSSSIRGTTMTWTRKASACDVSMTSFSAGEGSVGRADDKQCPSAPPEGRRSGPVLMMNPVGAQMLDFIKRRLDEDATSVPASEILAAVVPKDHPEYRLRPAYKHGLERLRRRRRVGAVVGRGGELRFYLDPDHIPWQDAAQLKERDRW